MAQDIYFEECYGHLYEKAENGKSVVWEYSGNEGQVRHQFIVREIFINGVKQDYCDIVTPYGYGGPLIVKLSPGFEKVQLIKAFEEKFSVYCAENKIVSEFVRFHPIIKNADDFKEIYQVEEIRHTLGTNLVDYENPVEVEFSKSCRKNIRKAMNNGVMWRITYKPQNIDSFKKIYYSTMDRNNAQEYYYFDDSYFDLCMKYFGDNILFVEAVYEEKTIAAGLYFAYNDTIHIHLSGTLSEYLYLSPAYILRYAVTLWGKENGYKLIHHGGGRSNSPEDSLFLFKKQFAKNTEFEFFVGKKIWNKEKYKELTALAKVSEDEQFFPAYRKVE